MKDCTGTVIVSKCSYNHTTKYEMSGVQNGKQKKKKNGKKRRALNVSEPLVVKQEGKIKIGRDEERCTDSSEYEDEGEEVTEHGTTIENYFCQGKLKSDPGSKASTTQKKKRKQAEDKKSDDCCDTKVICDVERIADWFDKCNDYIPDAVNRECTDVQHLFLRWLTYLATGFNLVIFGLGSKRKLLRNFCETALQDYTYVAVDGFQPTVNSKAIFQFLETNLSLKVTSGKSQMEYASAIGRAIDRKKEDVVVVLNNIDGPGLRPAIEQWALAEFANAEHTHIIATVDHINNRLLWTQKLLSKFNFLFINVNTMQSYKAEVFANDSKLLGLNPKSAENQHSYASLDVVWMSLTSNSRSLLHLIAQCYYQRKKPIEFFELYRMARDEFLVSTDTALRQHLNEYVDHRLIVRKHENDGSEYVSLAVDEKMMVTFLTEKGLCLDGLDDKYGV